MSKLDAPSPHKVRPLHESFQKAYLRPVPGLNIITSLYLVNILPNSNLHPPPKFSGSASDNRLTYILFVLCNLLYYSRDRLLLHQRIENSCHVVAY